MSTMTKTFTRTKGKEFCELTVELREGDDGFKTLSICGVQGAIFSRSVARALAKDYWTTFFKENSDALGNMNERCGTNYRSAARAADYVIQQDGDYHGLDVHADHGGEVLITEVCGQIRGELLRFFPEVEPYLPWHLNDMRPGCEHQETTLSLSGDMDGSHLVGARCHTCGYRYGSMWMRRELPSAVLQWFETLDTTLAQT